MAADWKTQIAAMRYFGTCATATWFAASAISTSRALRRCGGRRVALAHGMRNVIAARLESFAIPPILRCCRPDDGRLGDARGAMQVAAGLPGYQPGSGSIIGITHPHWQHTLAGRATLSE